MEIHLYFRELTKKELLDLISSYNNYVMSYFEEHDMGQSPVSIYEYYDNEYQEKKEVE